MTKRSEPNVPTCVNIGSRRIEQLEDTFEGQDKAASNVSSPATRVPVPSLVAQWRCRLGTFECDWLVAGVNRVDAIRPSDNELDR